MSRSGHGQSCTRTVTYSYHGAFDEVAVERTLAAALAAGVVTQYDTGRGSFLWFNGAPGQALRELRNRLVAEFVLVRAA